MGLAWVATIEGAGPGRPKAIKFVTILTCMLVALTGYKRKAPSQVRYLALLLERVK